MREKHYLDKHVSALWEDAGGEVNRPDSRESA